MDFFCHKFVYNIVNISCLVYLDVCTFSYHKNGNPFRKELGHKSDVFLDLYCIEKQTIPALFSNICWSSFQKPRVVKLSKSNNNVKLTV